MTKILPPFFQIFLLLLLQSCGVLSKIEYKEEAINELNGWLDRLEKENGANSQRLDEIIDGNSGKRNSKDLNQLKGILTKQTGEFDNFGNDIQDLFNEVKKRLDPKIALKPGMFAEDSQPKSKSDAKVAPGQSATSKSVAQPSPPTETPEAKLNLKTSQTAAKIDTAKAEPAQSEMVPEQNLQEEDNGENDTASSTSPSEYHTPIDEPSNPLEVPNQKSGSIFSKMPFKFNIFNSPSIGDSSRPISPSRRGRPYSKQRPNSPPKGQQSRAQGQSNVSSRKRARGFAGTSITKIQTETVNHLEMVEENSRIEEDGPDGDDD